MTKYVEIGVEFEPHIGVQAEASLGYKDTEAMSKEWKKAAEVNVKDDEVKHQLKRY